MRHHATYLRSPTAGGPKQHVVDLDNRVSRPRTSTTPRKQTGEITVLLIDNDVDLRGKLATALRDQGYVVREHTRLSDLPPLDTLADVSVVITGYRLADENGLAFADALHRVLPSTPVVMITAYWSLHLAGEVAIRNFAFLRRKPIQCDELCALVQDLCG